LEGVYFVKANEAILVVAEVEQVEQVEAEREGEWVGDDVLEQVEVDRNPLLAAFNNNQPANNVVLSPVAQDLDFDLNYLNY
jgi:hypothetical protein